ncbi:MAG: AAA family ATPase [Solirubrobacterales bacterium]
MERDDELAAVADALDEACRDGQGGTLLIEGLPGVGKTSLLGELGRRAENDGYQVLRARGSEMERDFGYGLVRQLLGALLRQLDPASRTRLFAGPAGLAAAIFGFGGGALDVGAAESSLYGLFWMLAGLAEKGPVVLAVDDTHWADSASLRFFRYLGQRLDAMPILLALAARPNEPGVQAEMLRGLAADLDIPTLRPAPLSEAGTAALVRTRLGAGAGSEVEAACHEATGGNLFLIEELLVELSAERDDGTLSAARIAAMGPERIAAGVDGRAQRLDPLAPELMRAAAVLGDASDLRALAALTECDRERAAKIVDGLAAAAILASGPGYHFVHPLVRAAVYERIPAAGRAALHARAAALLAAQGADTDAVAAHLLLCEPAAVEGGLAILERAATSAAERGAPDSAAAYLRRALEEPNADRAELLRLLGSLEVVLRDPAAIAHLQEAAELAEDPEKALGIYLELADLLSLAGQWDTTIQVVDAGLDRYDDPDLPSLLDLEAYRAAYRGYDPAHVAEFDRTLPHLQTLVAERPAEESLRLRWVLAALGSIREMPRAEVEALIEPTAQQWSTRIDGRETSTAAQGACALLVAEAFELTESVAQQLTEDGRRRGSLLSMIGGVGFSAAHSSRLGHLESAEADLNVMIELVERNDLNLMALTTFLHFCIDAVVERRDLAGVAMMVEELQLPPAFARTQSGGMLWETRAAIRAARGDRAGAVADLRATADIFIPLQAGPRFTQWRSRLALALPEAEREEALELAAEELELARAVEAARPEGVALRALGRLRGGEEGIETLRESVAVLRAAPARLELARSLAELGAALRRGNQRGEAREQLREAAELAQRCGAERLEERIDEELRIAGARPRRRALSGADSLTPGEQRVATAAASGATNREIAQDLFVSLRTVEMHLTNSYRKLEISSRAELAEAIRLEASALG